MKLVDQLFRKTRPIRKTHRPVKPIGTLFRLEDRIAPANVAIDSNFAGIPFSQSGGWVPPDTCGAAGTAQYVETVNQTIEIFNKSTGASLAEDGFTHFLFTTGGLSRVDGSGFESDPIVVWDEQIQRFIVGQQDVDFGSAHVSAFDLAVSTSATPTTLGASDWKFYKITTTEANADADYPGNFGWNHDAFVFTLNMFPVTGNAYHAQIVSVNIQDLVNGVTQANLHSYVNDDFNEFSLRPTVMHDSVAGDPMWFVEDNGDGKTIDVVKMTNVLSNSATITFNTLNVNNFTEISNPTGTPKQPNGSAITTNIDSRIMKVAEMNGTLVASQAITTASGDRDLARWYQISVSGASPSIIQQGNVSGGNAGTAKYYDVYPSVDINAGGDIGMTFIESGNVNSTTEFMSVYVTGRTPNDAAGTMETPILVKAGDSNNGNGREGDLSGINLDSDGTFWIANELTTGGQWNTWIAHITVNAAPVLAGIEVPNLVFQAQGAPEAITATTTVADPDNTTLVGATVKISSNYVSTEDVLGFTSQNGITGSFNSATGVMTLTGTATVAQYQAALRSVTYQDTNVNPSTAIRTISFQVNDGVNFNNLSNTVTRNITVLQHVAPVLAGIEGSVLPYTALQLPIDVTAALTVTDSDSSTIAKAFISITSNFVAGEDVLGFTNTPNITGSYNAATGVMTLTGVDTVANYQAALRTVTYSDSSALPTPSQRTITFQVDDGFGANNLSNTQTRNIGVTDHVAPLLAGIEPGTISYTAGSGPVNITSAITVADSDSATIAGATVTISSGFVVADDVLAFTSTPNITSSYNPATGVLTLTGVDTIANYQAALRNVTYNDPSATPTAGTRTVTFQVNDGFANNNFSNTQSRNISVGLHVAPVLSGIEGGSISYVAGQGPVNITSSLTVTDSDNPTIASATVSISSGFVSGDDVLSFTNTPNITSSYNAASGVLTLTGVDTVAAYQSALQSVIYNDPGANPTAGTRTISFQVDDGYSNNSHSNTQSRNVVVTLHVAPVLSGIEAGTIPYTAGQGAVNITSALTVTDSDSTSIAGATVTISSGFAGAEDVLGFVNQNGITGSYNGGTGVLTLTGVATLANYQTALQTVTYTDTNLLPAPGIRAVTFQVNDGWANHNLSNTQSRNISVSDHVAPVLANIESGTIAYTAGQAATTITGALTVADGDSNTISSATVSITTGFASGEDVLAFTNTPNIAGSYNSATGVLTLTGVDTLANYQAALYTVTYQDTNLLPVPGTRTVTFQANDGFANNNISNTQTRNISVTDHVAPVLGNIEPGTIAYTAGQAATTITGALTVGDSDSNTISSATVSITSGFVAAEDALAFSNTVNITGSYNSATGVLTLTGLDTLANYQAALYTVTYQDTNLLPVAATRTVTFQVNDGFANNNISNTQSRNISVTDHVAPALSNIEGSTISYVTGQGPVTITSALTVADSDSNTISSATASITAGFSSSQDTLSFTNTPNITGSYNAATGVLTLTGVDTLADYQSALQSVTYTNNTATPSTVTRTITFTVNDGFANNNISNTQSRNIAVSAHVAPALSGIEASTLAYGAGQAPTQITNTLALADAVNIASATVSITTGFHSAEDVLGFTNTPNITGSYNAATGVLTLTGVDTVADYQAALRTVTYQDTIHAVSTTTRTVTFQVTDVWPNNDISNTQARNINVTAHVAPVLAGIEASSLPYTALQAPTAITAALTVTDSDSLTIASATVSITSGFHSAEDVLSFANTANITGSYNAGTGVLTLTGVDTVANYQAALRTVTYNDTNVAPAVGTRAVTFQVVDTFGGNSTSNTQARNIAVSAHVAPVLAGIEGATLPYVAGQGPLAITGALTVSDSDRATIASATVSITSSFSSGEDVLAFANTANITGSYNAGTGVLTLSGVDTLANYQAALRTVTFIDNKSAPSTQTRTISFQANDGFGVNNLSNIATRKISVSAHVAPALANLEAAALPYTAGQAATALTNTVTLTDAAPIQSATVTISSGLAAGEDVLAFANTATITGSYNPATGVLTLTGVDTAANYQAALRTVTYQDTNLLPSAGTRTVSFSVTDTFAVNDLSNTPSRNVTVADHVAPVLSGIEGSALSFTAGQSAIAITSTLAAADSDSSTLAGATVAITSGFAAGEDVLAFTSQNGITGSYNAGTGVLTLSGAATVAQYQAALRTVTYVDTNLLPSAGARTITFTVNDGFANNNISNSQSRNINVSDHTAPVLSGIESAAISFTLGNAAVAITGNLTVADADSTTIASATVAITSGFVSGDDALAFTNQNGITGSYNSGTGVLTLTGTATLAQYQTALRSVTYFNGNAFTSLSPRSVTFTVNDGFANNNLSNSQSRTINVLAHVAPVLAGIESATAKYLAKQPAITVTTALTASDSDSATFASATVSIGSGFVSGEDVLAFTSQSGISGSYNAATGVLTLSGTATVAQYQAALHSVTYVDSAAKPTVGTRSVTFQVNDGFGNNNLSNTQSRTITVSIEPPPIIVVSGSNNAIVKVYDAATHALKYTLNPFDTGFVNGMHITTGVMTSDGAPDIFIAEGQVGFPVVAIYDGATGQLIRKLQAFSNSYRSGAFIAVADLEGTGVDDLVVSQGQGGQGAVAVYRGKDLINTVIANPKPLWTFNPYGTFSGGVSVAAFKNGATGYIVTAPLVGMQSWVQVYNASTHAQTARFLAYASSYTQGLTVAAGDVNGDGFADIVTAPNQPNALSIQQVGIPSSTGAIEVFGGNAAASKYTLGLSIAPYTPTPNSGIHVALVDVNDDGILDIVTAPATTTNNAAPPIKAFNGSTGADLSSWDWIDADFLGGVYIG